MSPQLSPEQFLWMTVFLFPWRTMLPVIMWWNGMMPPAGRTVLWTGSRWPLQTNSPLLNQVCQSLSQLYMGRGRVHPRMRHQVIAGPYVSIWATLPCSVVPRQCPEGVCVPPPTTRTPSKLSALWLELRTALLFSAQSPPHWAVTTPHIYCSVSFLLLLRVTLVCSLCLQPTSSQVWDTTFPCTVALQRLHSCCSAGRDTCKSWVRVRLHMGKKFIILSSF